MDRIKRVLQIEPALERAGGWADALMKPVARAGRSAAAAVRGRSRSRSRSASRGRLNKAIREAAVPPALPLSNMQLKAKEKKYRAGLWNSMLKKIEKPKEGNVVYDADNNAPPASEVAIYEKGQWIVGVLDRDGDYGGPYPDTEEGKRRLLANPRYRTNQANLNGLRAAGTNRAATVVDDELAKAANVANDKKPAAREEALKRVRELLAKGETDSTKLATAARRGFKVAGKAAKGGSRRARKMGSARRKTRRN